MRSINLLKLAGEAEMIRLRAMMQRQSRRAAFGAAALIFMIGVLASAEIAGWQVLRFYVAGLYATLILLGINLMLAGVLGFLAARSPPGYAEREALHVRKQALVAARGSLAFTAAIPAATRLLRLRRTTGHDAGFRRSWLRPFG